MLRRVLVLGGIAAADVPALKTGAQMHPCIADRNTFVADVYLGREIFAVCKVLAKGHIRLLASRETPCTDANKRGTAKPDAGKTGSSCVQVYL